MRLYVKNKLERAGGGAQMVARLPSKHQALSSSPSTDKTKKKIRNLKHFWSSAFHVRDTTEEFEATTTTQVSLPQKQRL
jgi:hypothetical protein